MKWIMLSLLVCVVALEAKPRPYLGLNRLGMTGLGNEYGNDMIGLGLGLGNRLMNTLGMGRLGLGTSGSGYTQGSGFGDSGFSSGANGFGSQGFHNRGGGHFHDIGEHHSSLTSINQAENTDNHDIGGSQFFDTGAQSGNGFNQYGNGFNRYGNGYGSEQQMTSFL